MPTPTPSVYVDLEILADVKKSEGWPKYTNHKNDLGGPTKGGITLDTLRTWRKKPSLTAADLQALTEPEADAIYRWMFIRPWDLITDPALRHYMVDLGVLRGPARAAQMLQDVVGIKADGWIGSATVKAIERYGARIVMVMVIGARFTHIQGRIAENASQAEYRNGWRARNDRFLADTVLKTKAA